MSIREMLCTHKDKMENVCQVKPKTLHNRLYINNRSRFCMNPSKDILLFELTRGGVTDCCRTKTNRFQKIYTLIRKKMAQIFSFVLIGEKGGGRLQWNSFFALSFQCFWGGGGAGEEEVLGLSKRISEIHVLMC